MCGAPLAASESQAGDETNSWSSPDGREKGGIRVSGWQPEFGDVNPEPLLKRDTGERRDALVRGAEWAETARSAFSEVEALSVATTEKPRRSGAFLRLRGRSRRIASAADACPGGPLGEQPALCKAARIFESGCAPGVYAPSIRTSSDKKGEL